MSSSQALMEEVASKTVRDAWRKNCNSVKDCVMKNNRNVAPGHLDIRDNMMTEQMLDHTINYIDAYDKALKLSTSDKFWDSVMTNHADDSFSFLLDWSKDVYYTSQRKTLIP